MVPPRERRGEDGEAGGAEEVSKGAEQHASCVELVSRCVRWPHQHAACSEAHPHMQTFHGPTMTPKQGSMHVVPHARIHTQGRTPSQKFLRRSGECSQSLPFSSRLDAHARVRSFHAPTMTPNQVPVHVSACDGGRDMKWIRYGMPGVSIKLPLNFL